MLIYVARAYYLGSKVFHCMNILLFILLIDIWVVFSPEILQTCCHEHFYSCLLVHVFVDNITQSRNTMSYGTCKFSFSR